ncbi:YEATS domain-containing protein 4 [Parasteatoda tepidariorum]|uniref:YEATS domain-containing protein 4 n=1 Tax=Parasteatoda tepidariorum TaxID=114398 RepID=UPI001C71C9B9|nr:YEATS domain-containing protein 4-like [Parasteatoda tepidariorum]
MESKPTVPLTVHQKTPAAKASGQNSKLNAEQEAGGRLKGVQVVKPIVYGNVAWYLGEKRQEDGHTHQWNVYLKAYDHEDMSVYVKRVHFKLHESYADPNRVCHAPPYGVTETGWGEFEVVIKIFFQDSNERPVTIYHFLKLFDREKDGNVKNTTVPVNSEFYDELVFCDPTVKMHRLLSHPKLSTPEQQHNTDYEGKKVQDLQKVLTAKKKVKQEIDELKTRLAEAKENILKLKSNVSS